MARTFTLESLFHDKDRLGMPAPYKDDDAVLDAVQARRKALYFTTTSLDWIAESGEEFVEMLNQAFDRGLAVVLQNRHERPRNRREPDVFMLHLDQAWRIPAHNALRATATVDDGRWSWSAEAQQGLLFGYSAKQRKQWLAWWRQRMAAWGCLTMYALLTDEQRRRVRDVGGRCFGATRAIQELELFFPWGHELRPNAYQLVPKGLTLARCGLRWKTTWSVFGDYKRWKQGSVICHRPTAAQARLLNQGMTSNVEFLAARGWRNASSSGVVKATSRKRR